MDIGFIFFGREIIPWTLPKYYICFDASFLHFAALNRDPR